MLKLGDVKYLTFGKMFDLLIQLSLDQCRNFCYNAGMETYNSFAELLESTQNAPFDVTSNPNGTVTSGAVQPPASIPPAGSQGAGAGSSDEPPDWHKKLAQRVEQGFAATNQKFDQVDQRFGKIDQRFDKVEQAIGGIQKDVTGIQKDVVGIKNAITEINKKLS
jgi:hypothetical protein